MQVYLWYLYDENCEFLYEVYMYEHDFFSQFQGHDKVKYYKKYPASDKWRY